MADTQIWTITLAVVALTIVALAVYAYKNKKMFKPWTDEKWIEAGGIFLLVGYLLSFVYNDGLNILMTIGALYLIVGLVKKYVVKEKGRKKSKK